MRAIKIQTLELETSNPLEETATAVRILGGDEVVMLASDENDLRGESLSCN